MAITSKAGPTLKQRLFAEAYIANNGNAYAAAKSAGYHATTDATFNSIGFENLRKPVIIEYMAVLEKRVRESNDIDLDWIVSELKDNASKAKEAGQYAAANSALGLIGKALGLIIERTESKNTNISWDVAKVLEGMSPEQLRAAASVVEGEFKALPESEDV